MIVRGYSIDVYCDNEDVEHEYMKDRDSFGGAETYQQCAKMARAQGWYLSRDRRRALCPKCNPKHHQQPKLAPEPGGTFDVMAAYRQARGEETA